MRRATSGVIVGPLPKLKGLLHEWIKVQRRYAGAWEWMDVPWYYNERASLSTLAAAAWLSGGLALEEFSNEKWRAGRPNWKQKRRVALGRCDLYVVAGGADYLIEAKAYWPKLRGSVAEDGLHNALRSARDDATRVRPHETATRLAAVLIAPSIPVRYWEELGGRIDDFVSLLKRVPRSAAAWTFPTELAMNKPRLKSGSIYPGAAVVLQPLRTSARTKM